MASGKGVISVIGGGRFFGTVTVTDTALENAIGYANTDMYNISGEKGSVTVPVIGSVLFECETCPLDAVDLT